MACLLNTWTANSVYGLQTQYIDCKLNAWTSNSMHGLQTKCMDFKLNTWTANSIHLIFYSKSFQDDCSKKLVCELSAKYSTNKKR